jgi:hypothetical protein
MEFGEGKAKKYGKEFVELISHYVVDIRRPEDLNSKVNRNQVSQ